MKSVLIDTTINKIRDIVDEGNEFPVSLPLKWITAPDSVNRNWSFSNDKVNVPPAITLSELRIDIIDKIDDKMINLVNATSPLFGNMAGLNSLIGMWGYLNNPGSNAELSYVKNVYDTAQDLKNRVRTATKTTLQSFDVDNPVLGPVNGWPAVP